MSKLHYFIKKKRNFLVLCGLLWGNQLLLLKLKVNGEFLMSLHEEPI